MVNQYRQNAYPMLYAFIDVDGNGRCDVGVDAVWSTPGSVVGIVADVSPADFVPSEEEDCSLFER